MKKNILLALFLLQSVFVFAQSNFKPGSVITNANDTLRGYIDYRTDEMNTRICRFKTNLNDKEAQSFAPGEIAGFRFTDEGKFYVTRTIEIIAGQPQTVFLEFLVKGMLNLFYFPDAESKQDFFIFEDREGNMTYTTQRPAQIVGNDSGRAFFSEDMRFRNIIAYRFPEFKPVQQEVQNMAFDRSSMINFVRNYHNAVCTSGEECIVFEGRKNNPIVKWDFFVSGGMEYQTFKDSYRGHNQTTTKIAPLLRAGVEFSFPRWQKSLSALLSIYATKMSGNFNYTYEARPTYYSYWIYNAEHDFSANKIGSDFAIRYTYHKGKVRPYVQVGTSLLDYFSGKNHYLENRSEYNTYNSDMLLDRKYKAYNIATADAFSNIKIGVGSNFWIRKNQFLFFNIQYNHQFGESMLNLPHYIYFDSFSIFTKYNIWQFEVGYRF